MKLSKLLLIGCIAIHVEFVTAEPFISSYFYDLSVTPKAASNDDMALNQCNTDCDARFSKFNLTLGKLNQDCKQKCLAVYQKLLDMKAKTDLKK